MTPRPETGQVMLSLSPAEQWTVHHVLLDRIDLERRSPTAVDPPPVEVFHAFEKIEAGDSWFTPGELRCMRAELQWYLDRGFRTPQDRAAVEKVIDRISDGLTGRRRHRPSPGPGRRTRPR